MVKKVHKKHKSITLSNSNDDKGSEKKKESQKDFKFNLNSNIFKVIIPILLILLVSFVAFDVRSGPINLDGLDENIKLNTLNQIKTVIASQVNSQYPNLPQTYRDKEIEKEFNKVLANGEIELGGQKVLIADVIKQNSAGIKEAFKAENGQTYLNAIDPYHWLRYSELYYKNGFTGNEIKIVNGTKVMRDSFKKAPIGIPSAKNPEFHIWLISKLFKFHNLDENSTIGEKTKAIYLIPVIFAMLSVIPAFFIIRRFSNDLFAFFGSLLLVTIGTFVSRTVAGFVDTDAYIVFFSMLIVVFLIYAFMFKSKLLTTIFGTLAGISQALFIWAWTSGWFIFVFSIAALIIYLGFVIIVNLLKKYKLKKLREVIENDLIVLFSFIISSVVISLIFLKQNLFELALKNAISSISSIAAISHSNIWPNVGSSVAELNAATFGSIMASVGGNLIFMIALLGLLFLSLDFKVRINKFTKVKNFIILGSILWFLLIIYGNLFVSLSINLSLIFLIVLFLPIGISIIFNLLNYNKSDKIFITILLSIWVAGTIYMSLNGVRFILLLAPPFAISFGIGLYYISKIINEFIIKEFKVKTKIKQVIGGFVIVGVLFFTLYTPMWSQAQAISKGTMPNFDDSWYSTMNKIKENSNETAIITSWWDFGHFFTAIGERGVTFDGGTQVSPRSHWVGKLLLENDEEKATDILQMLVCGGNNAFDKALSYTSGSNADAVKINKILYQTFGKDKLETRSILENNKYFSFSAMEIESILDNLKCDNPRENFVIASEDMVGKAPVWAHWGSWDFTKKYTFDSYKSKSAQEIAIDIDENVTLIKQYIGELKDLELRSQTQNLKLSDLTNQWFAPYPGYMPIGGSYTAKCINQKDLLTCENSLQINMTTAKILNDFKGQVKFKNLIIPQEDNTLLKIPQNLEGNVDALLIPSGNQTFNIMLMQSPLGASLFTKLFYLDGFGTRHFDVFDYQRSVTGAKIKTYKTNWNPQIKPILKENQTIRVN